MDWSQFVQPVLIGAFVLVWLIVRVYLARSRGGAETAAYGAAGGAVCPHCGRAFARSLFSPNLVVGKLSRCPHCGTWSIARRATPAELAAAEQAHRPAGEGGPGPALDPEAALRARVEESKYEE